ncbi:sigma-54 dependent transcriptional regulator [Pseudomonadota bacterium]|nr:sigma-54 dependent transcriptional regulator [Pseudomonadota bacterium]
MIKILLVEDEHLFAKSVATRLGREGFQVTVCSSIVDAKDYFNDNEAPDALLLDVRLPDGSGLDFLTELRGNNSRVSTTLPVIIMTAYGELEDAVLAMKLGANDYLKKPVDLDELGLKLSKVLETGRIHKQLDYSHVRDKLDVNKTLMLGSSAAVTKSKNQLDKIARLVDNSSDHHPVVLIRGETGTGKDVAARYYHQAGSWHNKPFVHVDCASLPRDLMEAELFGYERGAFTNAHQSKAGLIEIAEEGTLFFDEVGELPLDLQVKLLNVLERRIVRRIGATKEVAVKAHFIAATNRDLNEMVIQGEFRSDLYFRLNILEINLPSLKERSGDILILAQHFMSVLARRYNLTVPVLSTEVLNMMNDYSWPGNIRELKHVLERAVMLCQDGIIRADDIVLQIAPQSAESLAIEPVHQFEKMTIDEAEKYLIEQALSRTDGNVSQSARELGLTRMAMRYRMDKYFL